MSDNEKEEIVNLLETGSIVGNGDVTKKFENELKKYLKVKNAFFVNSGTSALEAAMMSLNVQGSNVIVPDFTFTSVPNSILRERGTPVFVDVDKDYLNLDPNYLEKIKLSNMQGIINVHYAGMVSNQEKISQIAEDNSLFLVEDAAHAIGSEFKGIKSGTLSDIGCFSFHFSKNLPVGEGGAIVTNDDEIAQRLEIIIEKGTNRTAFFRGEVDKYGWKGIGSSFVQSDLMAKIGLQQLAKLDERNKTRRRIANRYISELGELEKMGFIELPKVPEGCTPNWHIFHFKVNSRKTQDEILKFGKKQNVAMIFHYPSLSSFNFASTDCKTLPNYLESNSYNICNRVVRIPMHPFLTDNEIDHVITTIKKFYKRN